MLDEVGEFSFDVAAAILFSVSSILSLITMPIGSAAMGRMPFPLESLAVFPVVQGLVFALRSLGFAYSEVVVALMDRDDALRPLRRFAWQLATGASAALLLVAATPLSVIWFERVSALDPDLSGLARRAIWLTVLFPATSVLQALFTGTLVNLHRTRGIMEAVALHAATVSVLLLVAGPRSPWPGLYVTLAATLAAYLVQVIWLARRAAAALAASAVPPAMAADSGSPVG